MPRKKGPAVKNPKAFAAEASWTHLILSHISQNSVAVQNWRIRRLRTWNPYRVKQPIVTPIAISRHAHAMKDIVLLFRNLLDSLGLGLVIFLVVMPAAEQRRFLENRELAPQIVFEPV